MKPTRENTNPEDSPGSSADSGARLDAILAELRAVSRLLRYRDFSLWTLIGGLAQLLVFLAMFLWFAGGEEGHDYLLMAILLQLMALTSFVASK